jgi:GTPase SAR1 family protein
MNIKPVENAFFVYKVIILGDSGVGKTCLSVRYCEDHYSSNKQVTVGVDFKEKQI